MVSINKTRCPECGEELYFYDRVKRIVRTKGGHSDWIFLRRLKCRKCSRIHRELPEIIFPYKHYEAEIIKGVREGLITPETLGYEDYPCEKTMFIWIFH